MRMPIRGQHRLVSCVNINRHISRHLDIGEQGMNVIRSGLKERQRASGVFCLQDPEIGVN